MWNAPGFDEDDDSRQLHRSPNVPRYYTNHQARFGTTVRGEGVWLSGSTPNVSNQNNYPQSGAVHRYQYQNPFWMAPN